MAFSGEMAMGKFQKDRKHNGAFQENGPGTIEATFGAPGKRHPSVLGISVKSYTKMLRFGGPATSPADFLS